jgi:hypothetical protein
MTSAMREAAEMEPPPPPRHGEPDKRGLYSFARYTVQDDHYIGLFQIWTKTILFLMGRQWLKWLAPSRRFTTDTDVPAWRQQPVTNIVFAIYRSIATKMAKQKPTLEVVPPSGDSEDQEAARLGQSILQNLWRSLKMPKKIRRALGWFLCAGTVYLRVWWDPEAGKMVPLTTLVEGPDPDFVPEPNVAGPEGVMNPADMDPNALAVAPMPLQEAPLINRAVAVDPKTGGPRMRKNAEGMDEPDFDAEPDLVPEGDIAFDVEDPMAVRFNPDAIDEEDATEMFVGRLWPTKKAASHFGCSVEYLKGGDDSDRVEFDNLLSSAAVGWGSSINLAGSSLGASQDEAIGPRSLIIEYYQQQSPEYPEGRHWISCGDKIVWPKPGNADFPTGEAPLPNGFWPPLIGVASLPIPGQPQALGTLTQVVPLNEQLNSLDGKIKEHEVTMAMGGKWIVHPADKGLRITSDPAQVLQSAGYAAGKPPIQAQLNALPVEIYNERAVIMDKVRLVASLSEIDLGKKPEGVSAGRAFLVMQEVTDSVLGPDLQAWEEALEEVGRRQLILAQRHYREPRSIAIRGQRGQWEVRSFMGADLTDGLDVRVQVGSTFPWSKAAQWDTRLDLISTFPALVTDAQTGAFNQEAFAKFMDTGNSGLAAFETDENADLVEVQREHAMFEVLDPAKGEQQIPQLAFWQAHAKHLEAHYDFMKRDRGRFDRWTPFAQDAFVRHMQEHAMAVDEIAQGMVDASTSMVADGGAEGQGAPGGPEIGEPASGDSMEAPQLQDADFAAAE